MQTKPTARPLRADARLPRSLRRALLSLLALIVVLLAAWWFYSRPVAPEAFYVPPDDVPARPGALLRSEPFTRGVPARAQAWRILYTTTRDAGAPAIASAIVVVPAAPAATPRPVVAWTHGTTGVMPGCAPSLLDAPFANVPAFEPALAAGWAIVATDYVGQGTPGPHPYLIGEGQARSALDAVRAARAVESAALGAVTVVWGHSQGGNAALWTAIRAPGYAPDAGVVAVAAVAPASDLRAMIRRIADAPVGRIMTSYVLQAYDAHYDDVDFDAYTRPEARWLARDMAGRCLAGRQSLLSVAEAMAAGGSIFARDPAGGALGERLAQNTPDARIGVPVLLAQGDADDLVLPDVQRAFVARRCAAGQAIDYRRYPGRDHLSVVAPDSPYTADLMAWTRDRFAGKPAPATCSGLDAR
ncbi:alpha/beta fold hydrolase [Cognatilysobacter tabacisoli]|uniref:alpha/beta fold hydrolase n=1 Tax=Cognatilysobacter tabacisoli TaxID=2315424 RepID=UPI000E6AF223|nr:alpha/beta fold hydrolase [Lysobacter tabacisoli]